MIMILVGTSKHARKLVIVVLTINSMKSSLKTTRNSEDLTLRKIHSTANVVFPTLVGLNYFMGRVMNF
jgi:hypothetical protein